MNSHEQLIDLLAQYINLSKVEISELMEIPPRAELGDYAFPCFALSKTMRKAPQIIAAELKEKIGLQADLSDFIERIEVAGAYLNFFIKRSYRAINVIRRSLAAGSTPGASDKYKGKNIIVEYSSPNIAKPFHVGHAFTTFLGEAIANLFDYQGANVFRFNHLGDYGTQFGKLIVAWKLWGDEEALARNAIEELTRVYVKFHQEAESTPELEDEAREAFRRLENREEEELSLWQQFRDVSLKEFNQIYRRLKIDFDNTNGESFYSDMIPEVVNRLEEKDLLIESEGARVVDLEEYGLKPCLILKSDGSTIYASRDLAAILYRAGEYDYDLNIYVVGLPQKNHFEQVFAVAKKADFPNADKNVHVAFGTVKMADGSFSTRSGNVILLEDLLETSVEKTAAIIRSNYADMPEGELSDSAEKIGLGAVRYAFLRNGRERDIIFSWEEMLDFEGDTAPYLMYTVARCMALARRAGVDTMAELQAISDDALKLLVEDEEQDVLKNIELFPVSLERATILYEPSVMMRQIMTLARSFNRFYHNQPILRCENHDLLLARLALSGAVERTLRACLKLAGIEAVERM
ncbi:MAG: arginine--tRNA ligase [Clostridiaceae bacterium]|nr:arginine--tRNA ligase [Clostridiaceae bacterium]